MHKLIVIFVSISAMVICYLIAVFTPTPVLIFLLGLVLLLNMKRDA